MPVYSTSSRLTAATETKDTCPNSLVLVGFKGQRAIFNSSDPTSYVVSELQPICGELSVSQGSVVVNPGTLLPLRGTTPGAMWASECPVNQVASEGNAGKCSTNSTSSAPRF
jgi:hypothetical protein